jgi:putative oxidoreductase
MKIAVVIARSALGLVFLIFGLDYFLGFIQHIVNLPPAGDKADTFFGALAAVKYFFPFLKSIEIICGLCLLLNRYPLFFTIAIFPVTVNIFVFHACVAYPYIPLGTSMLLLNLFLVFAYRKYYISLFTTKPTV